MSFLEIDILINCFTLLLLYCPKVGWDVMRGRDRILRELVKTSAPPFCWFVLRCRFCLQMM